MSKGILIADDSSIACRVNRSYLTHRDFEICSNAVDGIHAIEKATELDPTLVLLDLRMPRINGLEAASVLRAWMPNLRIVLVIMYSEALSIHRLVSTIGIDAIVSKPDGFGRVSECIQRFLGSAQGPPESQA
jgi:DNA-binding NarL/FixJ family response regulator